MGRVVKNPTASEERYVVAPPHASGLGNGKTADEVLYADTVETHVEPEPVFPAPVEAEPIDWPSLHHQAGELLQSATADAEAILSEAHTRLRTIVESAQTGAAEITQEARSQGHDSGYREGVAKAETEMEEMLTTMRGLIDMARVERHKIVEGAEPEIVRLAMGIAEKILHKSIETDRDVVVAITKAAIAELVDRESITVRVNPIDLERMKQHRDSMLALGETKHMRVIEDQRVDPGGVVVETEAGSLDAKIETQVEEAKRVLRVEGGEFLVEHSPDSLRGNGSGAVTAPPES
ncbi:MAG TPA: FliH/SctL family protein [Candidatus Baltobacteraceae bacterium]|jgi:flagellar assembly protein FliH